MGVKGIHVCDKKAMKVFFDTSKVSEFLFFLSFILFFFLSRKILKHFTQNAAAIQLLIVPPIMVADL